MAGARGAPLALPAALKPSLERLESLVRALQDEVRRKDDVLARLRASPDAEERRVVGETDGDGGGNGGDNDDDDGGDDEDDDGAAENAAAAGVDAAT